MALSFLKTQAAAPQPAALNVSGANDRIGVAVIGLWENCSCFGLNHLIGIQQNSLANNTRVVAACDVFRNSRQLAVKTAELKESQLYSDYRKLLERADVDAIVISTYDVLHGQIALDALEAGKHIYCDRPFTRYLDEAFRVSDKVKSSGKVFQIGVASCSAGAWSKCAEMVQAGRIGTLVWGQASYCRNSTVGEWNYLIDPEVTPQTVDWQQWLGPVRPRVPFLAEDFCRWNKYYRYGSGLLGLLASFRLHALMLATGKPEFPVRVDCIGTRNVHSDLCKPGTPERDVPEHIQLVAAFPSGFVLTITSSSVNSRGPGLSLYGHKGTLKVAASGEAIELLPEKEFAGDVEANSIRGLQPEDVRLHEKDWFDCIRSGKQPAGNIELAIRAQTVLSLAEIADRQKCTCLFDEKTRQVTDSGGRDIEPRAFLPR